VHAAACWGHVSICPTYKHCMTLQWNTTGSNT
jgi:hypothetical protein